jgi:multiple sugar transport system substrate-binding protein
MVYVDPRSANTHRARKSGANQTSVGSLYVKAGRVLGAVALAGACAVIAAGCGSASSSGPVNLNFYSSPDPHGTNVKAANACAQQSGGKYKITFVPLGNSADSSRTLLVRRLAAHDSDISLMNMDTIWTAEFAAAGWLRPITGAQRQEALSNVLPIVAQGSQYNGTLYVVPLNTNAQLLWYRRDLVPNPPSTWAQMIADAQKLPASQGLIEEQGQEYEGYTVWFNSLTASAGGQIVTTNGTPVLGRPAILAARQSWTWHVRAARIRRSRPTRRIRGG